MRFSVQQIECWARQHGWARIHGYHPVMTYCQNQCSEEYWDMPGSHDCDLRAAWFREEQWLCWDCFEDVLDEWVEDQEDEDLEVTNPYGSYLVARTQRGS